MMRNKLPATHPDLRHPDATRRRICTGRRRCRNTTAMPATSPQPGQVKRYQYPNCQPARTLWYHDHGVHYTGAERVLGAGHPIPPARPDGARHCCPRTTRASPAVASASEFDVGLIVSDMMFQANGSQLYDDRNHSGLVGRRHPGQRQRRGR